jgi:tRNA 2-thiouridine synthesizing protein E
MSETESVDDLFDEHGFLQDPRAWDRDLALRIADELGLRELQEDHWRLVDYIRDHYLKHGTLPWMAHVCRELDLEEECFQRLFGGPIEAWKIAGLPDPGEEARVYMENEEEP